MLQRGEGAWPSVCLSQMQGIQDWIGQKNNTAAQSIFFRGSLTLAGAKCVDDITPAEFSNLIVRCVWPVCMYWL